MHWSLEYGNRETFTSPLTNIWLFMYRCRLGSVFNFDVGVCLLQHCYCCSTSQGAIAAGLYLSDCNAFVPWTWLAGLGRISYGLFLQLHLWYTWSILLAIWLIDSVQYLLRLLCIILPLTVFLCQLFLLVTLVTSKQGSLWISCVCTKAYSIRARIHIHSSAPTISVLLFDCGGWK